MTRDPRLTLNARQQELLEWVQRDGFVTVDDLAAHFAVTPQTIRRDVNWLADLNLLRRYHGGASLPTSSENVSYTARQRMFHDEKRRIAALAASHIPDQASLFINLGTTTEEVARALNAVSPLDDGDLESLAALLPIVHVDFALSEVEYFEGITCRRDHADVAWHTFLHGHAAWFATAPGLGLLDAIRHARERFVVQ